jgi:serine palmitoyltransferase
MDKEIDDLVEEWTPEPLVGKTTAFEEAELERRPVIVGSACLLAPGYR